MPGKGRSATPCADITTVGDVGLDEDVVDNVADGGEMAGADALLEFATRENSDVLDGDDEPLELSGVLLGSEDIHQMEIPPSRWAPDVRVSDGLSK